MLNNRKELVKRFLNEGFTYRTLSSFSDTQLTSLSKKLFKEGLQDDEVKLKKDLADNLKAQAAEMADEITETGKTEEEVDLETDKTGNPDVDIDGTPLLREKEVQEKFASKAQQKHLYSVNPAAAEKLASKMTKSDYQKLPEYVNEQKMLEEWIGGLVESNEPPVITKGNFIKTIKENLSNQDVDSPYTIGTEAQQESFASVLDIANEMEPPMTVEVDGFDDEGHMNGYLQNPSDEQVIDLNICPAGDIKLNGNVVGGMELSETDRDNDGEYMGAPEATTAPTPLKTPTIAPSRPGEKKRRGPFEKPKTKPNPKARGNNSNLPDWLKSTNLGKALTQHG
jgi:hypothetical protein|tara:strand:+ start:8 stop:1024 length:1017 start_codon:yes stop_codon:yes gene_type:complete